MSTEQPTPPQPEPQQFPEFLTQARKNLAKRGKQDLETLGLAIAEETGELCQAILEARDEAGDRGRIRAEAIDLGALCYQILFCLDHPPCAACDRGDYQLGHSDHCPKSLPTPPQPEPQQSAAEWNPLCISEWRRIIEQNPRESVRRAIKIATQLAAARAEEGRLLEFSRKIAHKLNATIGLNDDEIAFLNERSEKVGQP